MVGTIQDQERDSYYQNISVDPCCPKSNATESRENTSVYSLRKGSREHTQRNETDPTSEEGQNLLEDTDRWCDQASLLEECYESRKRERIHED